MYDNLYLRPVKESVFKAINYQISKKKGLNITRYEMVNLIPCGQIDPAQPDSGAMLLVDDNNFCTELHTGAEPDSDMISGKTLYGGWLRKIWGHFLMGGTARLWPMTNLEFASEIDTVIFFSNDHAMKWLMTPGSNYYEIMRLLGLGNKMRIVSRSVKVEELLVPDISFEHDVFYSDEGAQTFRFIRENALKEQVEVPDIHPSKVFFTRSGLKNAIKDEINISHIEQLFANNGYTVISPETLSITEMVHMLDKATDMVSLSGSTAHNFVFTSDASSKRFAIIERHAWVNTFQITINRMLGIYPAIVDAYYLPNFSTSQGFVFLYSFTEYLHRFVTDRNMTSGQFDKSKTRKFRRHELSRYLLRYRRYYGNSEALEPWEILTAQTLAEAVVETRARYPEWLVELRPLLWYDYLTPRFYLRMLKRLLKR
ncbi:MAG: glycosyltransferase 61 family protein [Pseudoflavonifractor sp.]|nr:glycosyltransferase 61 family protein [Pseudoflavonifractor sp.]